MTNTIEDVSEQTFDYVIVGGGTAGLTLAARLVEDPNIKVVVIEAGSDHLGDPAIETPAQFGAILMHPKYAWHFKTTPQPHLNGREVPWPRGKMLGGSSGVNFHVWNKPPAGDIGDWEKLGNPGWNWERFQKYAKKIEGFTPPTTEAQEMYRQNTNLSSHGVDGLIKTSFPKWVFTGEGTVQDAIKAQGIPIAKDPYGGDPIGTFMMAGNIDARTQTRSYAATSYYLPNKDKKNLTVICNSVVERLLFKNITPGEDLEASGVEFVCAGTKRNVYASKEVILSAGALKTPQILELSGIGDKHVLTPLGIDTKVDLPGVGSNVQEHLHSDLVFELDPRKEYETLDKLHDKSFATEQIKLHAEGKGMFTMGLTGFSFAPFKLFTATPSKAEELISALRSKINSKASAGGLPPGLKEQWMLQIERMEGGRSGECELLTVPRRPGGVPTEPGKSYLAICACSNSPFSRGTIHIKSNDPTVHPSMDPHYFEEEFDLKQLVEVVKFIMRLSHTEPLKSMIAEQIVPAPNLSSDEDLQTFVKDSVLTTWHTSSSASMLPRDKNGVVDAQLRVYGTKNVRIADLSIVPLHISAHTQSTAYVIGEAAADIILGKL
ncbi:GMC oxidoreductase [Rickenella mellea]|uniref:GMC oxidoreductase n=1 Tax=Rickenella mellea TaxID=50990 RepID=A0A4Y7Q2I5_9AGAM|nr:GMC oxidoreductase [Rickenella mellea]